MREFQGRIQYPQEAREAGTGGRVVVQFVVAADGRVEDAVVAHNSARGPGYRSLEVAAVRAVEAARFLPGMTRGGRTGPTRMAMPVTFNILH
jgi:TonB family protein